MAASLRLRSSTHAVVTVARVERKARVRAPWTRYGATRKCPRRPSRVALRSTRATRYTRPSVHWPLDTLGDFHYMFKQSRRLRGASAEASYEVGRDAAPAGVARNHVPGRLSGSPLGYYGPGGSETRERRKPNDAAVARLKARALAS